MRKAADNEFVHCPDFATQLSPVGVWETKTLDKQRIRYGIIPDHKHLYGADCLWAGLAVEVKVKQ